MADCKANDECGCAFWRPHDRKPFGYCALTNSECSDPTIGAQIDYTRIRTAIVKCGYSASASVQEGWPEETYDGVQRSTVLLLVMYFNPGNVRKMCLMAF